MKHFELTTSAEQNTEEYSTLLGGASNQVLKFADEDQKIELKILENSQLVFQAKPRMEYSLNIRLRDLTYKHSMEFRVQTSPHCVVSVGWMSSFAEGVVGQSKRKEKKTDQSLSVNADWSPIWIEYVHKSQSCQLQLNYFDMV